MNCPNCGTNNLDNATVCANCGRSLSVGAQSYTPPPPVSPGYGASPSAAAGMNIPNYLWQSVVATICCCPPLGIAAIIFAAQVNSKLAQGDTAGALESSRKAKMFALIAVGLGLVGMIIWFALSGTAIMQGIRDAQANQ